MWGSMAACAVQQAACAEMRTVRAGMAGSRRGMLCSVGPINSFARDRWPAGFESAAHMQHSQGWT